MTPLDIRPGHSPGNPDLGRYNYDQIPDSDFRHFLEDIEGIVGRQRWPFETHAVIRNVYPAPAGLALAMTSRLLKSVINHGVFTLEGHRQRARFTADTFRAFAVLDWTYKTLFAGEIRTIHDLPRAVDIDSLKQVIAEARISVAAYPHITGGISDLMSPSDQSVIKQSEVPSPRVDKPPVAKHHNVTTKRRTVSLGQELEIAVFTDQKAADGNERDIQPRENLALVPVTAQEDEGKKIEKSVVERMPQLTPNELEALNKLDRESVVLLCSIIPYYDRVTYGRGIRSQVSPYLAQVFRYIEAFYVAVTQKNRSKLETFEVNQLFETSLEELQHCAYVTSKYMEAYPQFDSVAKLFMAIRKKVQQDYRA